LHPLSAAEICRSDRRTADGSGTGGNGSMALATARAAELPVEQMADDRGDIREGDRTLLIVEDDPHYARIIADLAHDSGLKVLIAHRGAEALDLAREYQPSAVSLDVFLPDMLGWTVLSQLKQD